MKRSSLQKLTLLLAILAVAESMGRAFGREPPAACSIFGGCEEENEEEEEEKCSYGPCSCQERGTLFQWSYGTSFSGGPDLDEPIVTDRPDFTECSVTVGRGVLQVEMGYTYFYDNAGGQSVRTQSFGEPLFRYGILAEWLEFRVALFPIEEQTSAGGVKNSTAGLRDLYTGFKINITPQEGILPEIAFQPQMNIPIGSPAFTSSQLEPGFNLLYGWDVNDFLSTAGSTQMNRRIDDTDRPYLEFAQSWTIGYTLTKKLGAYTEWFALVPDGADTARTEHYFDGGFTYKISNDVQADIRAGVGLNDAAQDYFLGTGLSIRFR